MNIITLLPFIVLIGAMFLMTRSAKKKQRQTAQMRDQMEPGTGVRTIGGLYGTVKEVSEDTVVLEVAPGVHSLFAKNSIGAVLEAEEYERLTSGGADGDPKAGGAPVVPDDVSELTSGDDSHDDEGKVDLGKADSHEDTDTDTEATDEDVEPEDARKDRETDSK